MTYDKSEIMGAGWVGYKELLKELGSVQNLTIQVDMSSTDLSKRLFNKTSAWWVLLEYNDLPPVNTIEANTTLKIFSIKELDTITLNFLRKSKETVRSLV